MVILGYIETVAARAIKKIYRGYQLTKNVGHYGCLSKKNCQLKLSATARNTLNIWTASQYKFTL